jgi:arginine/ornithine transport system substrate-binding protein
MNRLIAAAFVVGLALSGAGDAAAQDRIRIGVEGAYPPFSEVTPTGELKGFDIDIAHALCEAMEVECELVPQDWDGIIPALNARKFDAIVASMSITEERRRSVDFTDKYYHTPARFVRQKGSGIEITPEDLQGKTVGVQRATTHDHYISDVYGDTVNIRRYATQDEAYLDMVAGRLDLLLADSVALQEGFLGTEQGQDYEFVGPALTDPEYFGEGAGIAVRKGDDELRERLNEAIRTIREDGTYDEIASRYFDFDVYGGEAS